MNALPSEIFPLMATIDPDDAAAGAQTSDRVDMSLFKAAMAVLKVGTMGTATTVDFKVQQHDAATSGNTKDITGAAITTLTAAGSDSDKQAIINVDAAALDVANGFRWVSMVLTTADTTSPASATVDCDATLFGCWPRYAPETDLASVDEIVSV